ncbi:hypothetical protein HMN09_01076800 [Mycena chlorophos]|uniref:Reverse transcriptase RNase H-like domain-containing protein n=1 Tax=Mycena chlorophos TaxID=658473 RepID=A0A8H6SF36_MYCCL|nr:hypothetical protein HMN09_01076800 [Mycena chlorophos]
MATCCPTRKKVAPLDPAYDFAARLKAPPPIDDPDAYPVKMRHALNIHAETFNEDSAKCTTRARDRKDKNFDVGLPFMPLYTYKVEEIELCADDDEHFKLMQPVPACFSTTGSVLPLAPSSLLPSSPLAHRELPPLSALTEERIASFASNPSSMPTKSAYNPQTDKNATIFDADAFLRSIRSTMNTFGPEAFPDGFVAVQEAWKTLLTMANYVAPKSASPSLRQARGLQEHVNFIGSLPRAGRFMQVWFAWSRVMMLDIWTNDTAYNVGEHVPFRTHYRVKMTEAELAPTTASNQPSTEKRRAPEPSSYQERRFEPKRRIDYSPGRDQGAYTRGRDAYTQDRTDHRRESSRGRYDRRRDSPERGRDRRRDSPRRYDDERDRGRDRGWEQRRGRDRSRSRDRFFRDDLFCPICTGQHKYADHSSNITTDREGRPNFASSLTSASDNASTTPMALLSTSAASVAATATVLATTTERAWTLPHSLPHAFVAHTPLVYPDNSASIVIRPVPPDHSEEDRRILERITTPYNAEAFRRALRAFNIEHEFPFLFDNLTNGFPIFSTMPQLTKTIVIPNNRSVHQHPQAVRDFINKEKKAGRCDGPHTREGMRRVQRGDFVSSGLLVSVSEQGPGLDPKLRICRHLSKSSKRDDFPAINDLIPKERFPTTFDYAHQVAEVVASAPDGTLACAFDIEAFHRTVPVHPAHRAFLVYEFEGGFYLDGCHPFGLRCASSNAGQPGGALVRIWTLRLGPNGWVMRYEDDMPVFIVPIGRNDQGYIYKYTHDEVLNLVADLEIPWHPRKCGKEFTDSIVFIGFLWDLRRRRVSLPDDKRAKYLARIKTFLSKSTVSLYDIQQIHGTLVHIAFVYRDGVSRLPTISSAMHHYPQGRNNEGMLRHIPKSTRKALEWWQLRLQDANAFRELRPLLPVQDLSIFVDASTSWGIGILIGQRWSAMRLRRDWRNGGSSARDICWLEAVALEVLFHFLPQLGLSGTHLKIHSDNRGAIGAHEKGRSASSELNLCVRRSSELLLLHDIVPSYEYVASADNPADPISRGELLHNSLKMSPSFTLPPDILSSLSHQY